MAPRDLKLDAPISSELNILLDLFLSKVSLVGVYFIIMQPVHKSIPTPPVEFTAASAEQKVNQI